MFQGALYSLPDLRIPIGMGEDPKLLTPDRPHDMIGNLLDRHSCFHGLAKMLCDRLILGSLRLAAWLILKLEGAVPLRVQNPRLYPTRTKNRHLDLCVPKR